MASAAPTITVSGERNPGEPLWATYRQPPDDAPEDLVLEAAQGIVNRLSDLAKEQVRLRKTIEERMLEDARNYHGRYTEETEKDLDDQQRSMAFVKITRAKTNSWSARLGDMLFPTDDRNWDVGPTPMPKLIEAAKAAVEAAKKTADQATAALQQQDPQRAEMLHAQADAFAQQAGQTADQMEEAKKRSKRMRLVIEDQLVEADYVGQCRKVIEQGCQLGTGILKGPITSEKTRREWVKDEASGAYQLRTVPDPQPGYRWVDTWHFFPDMSAGSMDLAEFTFERHLPSKTELRRMAMQLGFNRKAVGRLLRDGPPQFGNDVDHIAQLRAITGEGEQIKDRFVMWEYHGPLERDEIATLLRAAGHDELARQLDMAEDEFEEYRCIVYFVGNEVLKIVADYPLDSGDTLYSVWNFEPGETSIFGYGVPWVMNNSQSMVNGGTRTMMDNAGLSVGPQILVNKDLVEPQDGSYDMTALKVWLYSSSSLQSITPGTPPPFQVFNIPSNQQQLAGIIEIGKQFADEETGMPLVAQGEAGAQVQPVGTTSMLSNAANVIFRRIVKSWDDNLTKPTIRRAYDWNMQHHPDETIKGDMQVDARGSSVLLVKELQSQNMMAITTNWSVHPVLKHYLKVRESLEKTVQTMMIVPDEILNTEDEAEASRKREQQAMAATAQGAPPDNRLEIAQLANESRRELAMIQRDIAIMRLAHEEKKSIEEINARLLAEREKTASAERRHAADIAIERDREQRAVAAGELATSATGEGVG